MPGKGRPKKQGRARKGTGNVREVRPGYWRAEIMVGTDAEGKRIRKSVTGRSPEEVEEKLDELRKAVRQGLPISNEQITVTEHFEDWLRTKKPNVRNGTFKRYEWHFESHIKPTLGRLKLKHIDYRKVNALYEHLDDKGLGKRTVFDISTTLRAALEDAVRKGLIPSNPAKLAAKRSAPKDEARFLTQDETKALLKALEGEWFENFFVLLLHTGLRPGEALGLSWDAVDLSERKLTVRQALHEEKHEKKGGGLYLGDVKTKAGRRTITLTPDAVNALKRQRSKQREAEVSLGFDEIDSQPVRKWQNHDNLVFTSGKGAMVYRTNIYKRDLPRIRKRVHEQTEGKISLEGVSLHSFRHTHASMLIAAGVDIKTVSRRLGHENIRITLDLYGHLLPGQDEKAAEALGKFLASM